ncbi:ATP-binding protein [Bdellovibrio bacteriovorus]|uniref:ATP-binding protein n=1 Tax=Bdellovibrio bacteriovorus TaxID=959 RepID=UPI0021D382AE|nr:ATP-binding protein [Bdellovibrio bacteriovorus]UXR65341.1 ATP-binding protein [Bdellovibrio bacteriovorus]
MKIKANIYPVAVALLLAIFSFASLPDIHRVAENLQIYFVIAKVLSGVFASGLAFYFYKEDHPLHDGPRALLFATCIFYCVSLVWMLPLYEAAYLECAVGCAFIKTKRKWFFPLFFGAGGFGIILSYWLQEQWQWKIPAITRQDWVLVIVICFILSWFIQRYAIDNSRREKERLLRLSRIGHETNRLLHDVKGMISSPLIAVEAMSAAESHWTVDDYQRQLKSLNSEMKHIRDMLHSINKMTRSQRTRSAICIREVFTSCLQILERRLHNAQISLPTQHIVHTDADVLRSALFNLMLNTVEAFERNKTSQPSITAIWDKSTLIYSDNAGSYNSTSGQAEGNSGVGMEILKSDLESLGIAAKIKLRPSGIEVRMKFPQNA